MRSKKAAVIIGAMAVFMLIIGVVLGSVYQMKTAELAEIEGYLRGFLERLKGGTDARTVFFNALKENLICLGVMAVSGLFRLGFVLNGALILRRGFVMGFTAAGFIKCFGGKGMLAVMSMLPSAFLSLPAMVFFAAVSTLYGFRNEKANKNEIMRYVMLVILTGAIFCMAAAAEGYLSTIFMKQTALGIV